MCQAARAGRRTPSLHSQVLSLGAGFDTTFFQLAAAGIAPAVYAELDFEEVRVAVANAALRRA